LKATQTHEFGVLEIHDSYVKAIMFEGITVKPIHNKVLIAIAQKYFPNKKFGYITHRLNSYSVDPRVYIDTSKIKNLVAFAVVSKDPMNLSNTEVEKLFLKKPFRAFKKMEEAITWVEEIISKSD
jgi:hypothetical protein